DEDALAAALAEGRGRDLAAGRTLTGPHRTDLEAALAATGLPAAQASTGEQKALLLSVILAQARALATRDGAPPVMLLDEVAAHLDADRRAALFAALCDLGAQAWMTGTEAGLFAPFGGRAQAFGIRLGPAGSRVEEAALS
ncbi:MAG: DNA replication and repair protein RecF, partial [Rhodobacteraceae bacterium]|nr:DNA replication and repair protein RecF [Paracoccaceae bacterium]